MVALEDLRSGGHAKLDALTRRAVLTGAAPRTAPLRLDPATPLEAREVAQIRVHDYDDVTARPAVTAVGPAFGHVLLAPKAERTVAAAPGLHPDASAIVEHVAYSEGVTATVRRSPLDWYSTLPSRVAKIVSSRPMPAPGPGRNLVPR